MRTPKFSDQTIEQMLELLQRGYAWDFIAKRYRLDNESEARRVVREYQRRQRERGRE